MLIKPLFLSSLRHNGQPHKLLAEDNTYFIEKKTVYINVNIELYPKDI